MSLRNLSGAEDVADAKMMRFCTIDGIVETGDSEECTICKSETYEIKKVEI